MYNLVEMDKKYTKLKYLPKNIYMNLKGLDESGLKIAQNQKPVRPVNLSRSLAL